MDENAKKARREYHRAYRKAHSDKIRAYKRAWRRANPDKVRATQDRYWSKKAEELEKEGKDDD